MGIQVTELVSGRMPWEKEFIDFCFNGHHVSEYGMVAVTSGDRYSFAGSPDFADEVTTVNGVSGQYYWGTRYEARTFRYDLATDEMTERQFEEFKRIFRPGHYGQFYEDAWFDRYCYVRVKEVVDFNFIPFQKEVTIKGITFTSRVYKGECRITFVQDHPFKYSFYQILNCKMSDFIEGKNLNDFLSELPSWHGTDNSQAAIRMMYNSNIPMLDSWQKSIKCSTGSYYCMPSISSDDKTNIYTKAAFVPCFNPSTFDCETIISFTIQRHVSKVNYIEWEPVYFDEIYDDNTNPDMPYNIIGSSDFVDINADLNDSIEWNYKNLFKYTLPEVTGDINKAINSAYMLYLENKEDAMINLEEKLREEITNPLVLSWALSILTKIQGEEDQENQFYDNKTGKFKTGKVKIFLGPIDNDNEYDADWFCYFNVMMLFMFAKNNDEINHTDALVPNAWLYFYPYDLIFDGQQCQSFTTYKYNSLGGALAGQEMIKENCSNIVLSGYLKLDGGDKLDLDTGKVSTYHIIGFRKDSKKQYMNNVKIEYKYTYV